MSDPAVEAVKRAWAQCPNDGKEYDVALPAAREMAKPIREWYERETQKWVAGQGGVNPLLLAQLAPLIYSDDDLNGNQ
jgi:hypothetical protein